MIDAFLRDLRQPEYVHVLLNPIPIYGLAIALVGLLIAIFLRSRAGQIATLAIVLISAGMAWPVAQSRARSRPSTDRCRSTGSSSIRRSSTSADATSA